ncbi:MAG: hypothetical protein LBC92_01745 [Rickettsiales bacterium]|jgi:hypothetical protein|nr:hypothetical protein [Rickettsiales bacterium]
MKNDNPFTILGINAQTSKQDIVDIIEEKRLELDDDVIKYCKDIVLNPKKRLYFEIVDLFERSCEKITSDFLTRKINIDGALIAVGDAFVFESNYNKILNSIKRNREISGFSLSIENSDLKIELKKYYDYLVEKISNIKTNEIKEKILNNSEDPFIILGINTLTSRQDVIKIIEEKRLELGNEITDYCKNIVLDPKKRLYFEIVDLFKNDAHLRNIASVLLSNSIDIVGSLNIIDIVFNVEKNNKKILNLINRNRKNADFYLVDDFSVLRTELNKYRDCLVKKILNNIELLSLETQLKIIYRIMDKLATAPFIISMIENYYNGDIQKTIKEKQDKILNLVKDMTTLEPKIKQIDNLIIMLRNFGYILYPLRLLNQLKNIDEENSKKIMDIIRKFSFDIYHKHENIRFSRRLLIELQNIFKELNDIDDIIKNDMESLQLHEQYKLRKRGLLSGQRDDNVDVNVESFYVPLFKYVSDNWINKKQLIITKKMIKYNNNVIKIENVIGIRYGIISSKRNKCFVSYKTNNGKSKKIFFNDEKIMWDCSWFLFMTVGGNIIKNIKSDISVCSKYFLECVRDNGMLFYPKNIIFHTKRKRILKKWKDICMVIDNKYLILKSIRCKDIRISFTGDWNTYILRSLIHSIKEKNAIKITDLE